MNLLDLPLEIISKIAEHATIPARLSLWLSCKFLHGKVDILHLPLPVRDLRDLGTFLHMLEKDLPVNSIACDGCGKIHVVSTETSTENRTSQQWKCVLADHTSEWPLYSDDDSESEREWIGHGPDPLKVVCGPGLEYWKTRMALKLHRLQHRDAPSFLESLNDVLIFDAGQGPYHDIMTVTTKIVELRENSSREKTAQDTQNHMAKANLLARLQFWFLLDEYELTEDEWPQTIYRNTLTPQDNNRSREHFQDICVHIKLEVCGKGCVWIHEGVEPHRMSTIHGEFQANGSDNAICAPIYKCPRCGVEWRLDAIKYEGETEIVGKRPRGAAVLTKWMDLGNGESHHAFSWQARIKWVGAVDQTSILERSHVFHAFEGSHYVPQLDDKLRQRLRELAKLPVDETSLFEHHDAQELDWLVEQNSATGSFLKWVPIWEPQPV